MSDHVEQRIADFARRLEALNVEFEELKREAAGRAVPEPVIPPLVVPPVAPAVPAWLQHVDDMFRAGQSRAALREADRLRSTAVARSSAAHLAELLAYLEQVVTPERDRLGRLVFMVDRSLQFIRPADTPAAPPAPAVPPRVEQHVAPQPSLQERIAERVPQWQPPQWKPPRITVADLLGPRALAIAGGIVTLLGILFFFILAVDKGWLDDSARVALGGAAAAIVFAAGHWLRHRFGTTHSALAAVGTGIAGAYATLLSAAALYDLIPHWGALLAAAGIAAVGLVTALLWRSQLVAGLGLVGAILVPVALITQSSLSPLGVAFAAAVFVAAAIVGIRMGWSGLLRVAGLATAGQLVGLIAEPRYRFEAPASVLADAAFVALVFLATGVAKQLRSKGDGLDPLASWFTLAGAGVGVAAVSVLFPTDQQRGVAFLAIVGVYAVAGAVFFLRSATRDLSALLTFVTFSLGAVAVSEILTGQPLAFAWAAEAAGLAWLARRVREPRFQLWSVVYLLLALGHVLISDAQPVHLFQPGADPASGAPAALAFAAAAAVCAWYARQWAIEVDGEGLLATLTRYWMAAQPWLRRTTAWAAAVGAVYAASLWTLTLTDTFGWGWVAVGGLWTGVGVLLLGLAIRRPALQSERGSLIWIGASAAVAVLRCLPLAPEPRAWTMLVVAVVLLAASLAYQLVSRRASGWQMDTSALLAAVATAIGAFGIDALLAPDLVAYAWAAQSVLFAALAYRVAAPHLRLLSIVVLGLSAAYTLAEVAVPRQLLEPSFDPARGVVAPVAVALAATLIAAVPAEGSRSYRALAASAESFRSRRVAIRAALLWAAGAFATYAASLGVLALFTSFEWGVVAVAGLWISIGVAVFGTGAMRGAVTLRAGGLVWLVLTGALAVGQAIRWLDPTPRALTFAMVGVASLAVSVAYVLSGWRSRLEQPSATAVAGMAAALALFAYPIGSELTGQTQGAALLGLAAVWALVAAALFVKRARNFSTLYWAVAVVLAAIADTELLDATYAVLGWAAAGVAVAWLALRVREPRLYAGASLFLTLTVGRALIFQAPPTHLFEQGRAHPADGAASLFIAALALGAAAYLCTEQLRELRFRTLPWWLAGGIAVYGMSLVILELVERISGGTWQSGQTSVSAFWGVLGLALLYVGLKRGWRAIRFAGLALFPVVLAKIFFYDLPSLDSITRAFSFLAVGFVLLLGGFFYQRMTSDRGEPRRSAVS